MELPPWMQVVTAQLATFGLKLLGALAVWIIGRRLIALVTSSVHNSSHHMSRRAERLPSTTAWVIHGAHASRRRSAQLRGHSSSRYFTR